MNNRSDRTNESSNVLSIVAAQNASLKVKVKQEYDISYALVNYINKVNSQIDSCKSEIEKYRKSYEFKSLELNRIEEELVNIHLSREHIHSNIENLTKQYNLMVIDDEQKQKEHSSVQANYEAMIRTQKEIYNSYSLVVKKNKLQNKYQISCIQLSVLKYKENELCKKNNQMRKIQDLRLKAEIIDLAKVYCNVKKQNEIKNELSLKLKDKKSYYEELLKNKENEKNQQESEPEMTQTQGSSLFVTSLVSPSQVTFTLNTPGSIPFIEQNNFAKYFEQMNTFKKNRSPFKLPPILSKTFPLLLMDKSKTEELTSTEDETNLHVQSKQVYADSADENNSEIDRESHDEGNNAASPQQEAISYDENADVAEKATSDVNESTQEIDLSTENSGSERSVYVVPDDTAPQRIRHIDAGKESANRTPGKMYYSSPVALKTITKNLKAASPSYDSNKRSSPSMKNASRIPVPFASRNSPNLSRIPVRSSPLVHQLRKAQSPANHSEKGRRIAEKGGDDAEHDPGRERNLEGVHLVTQNSGQNFATNERNTRGNAGQPLNPTRGDHFGNRETRRPNVDAAPQRSTRRLCEQPVLGGRTPNIDPVLNANRFLSESSNDANKQINYRAKRTDAFDGCPKRNIKYAKTTDASCVRGSNAAVHDNRTKGAAEMGSKVRRQDAPANDFRRNENYAVDFENPMESDYGGGVSGNRRELSSAKDDSQFTEFTQMRMRKGSRERNVAGYESAGNEKSDRNSFGTESASGVETPQLFAERNGNANKIREESERVYRDGGQETFDDSQSKKNEETYSKYFLSESEIRADEMRRRLFQQQQQQQKQQPSKDKTYYGGNDDVSSKFGRTSTYKNTTSKAGSYIGSDLREMSEFSISPSGLNEFNSPTGSIIRYEASSDLNSVFSCMNRPGTSDLNSVFGCMNRPAQANNNARDGEFLRLSNDLDDASNKVSLF